jgi:hypothetical protein
LFHQLEPREINLTLGPQRRSSGRPLFLNRSLPFHDHGADEIFAMCKSRGSAASVQHDHKEGSDVGDGIAI